MSNTQLNYDKLNQAVKDGKLELVMSLYNIDYYSRGEDMTFIYAMSHLNKLAARTSFFETDDFYCGSDYAIVIHDNKLICAFEKD